MSVTVHNLTNGPYCHVGPISPSGHARTVTIPVGGSAVLSDAAVEHFQNYGAVAIDKVPPGYRGLAYQE